MVVISTNHEEEEPSMNEVSTIGVDLAKNVFQVHGVSDAGAVMISKRLRRRQMMPFSSSCHPA